MTATALASIIIPNYNHARYIGAAIGSALQQRYPHVEIIVVDDGSTDDSRAVVAPFVAQSGGRVRYLYQENRGLSAARNTGIAASRGEFVAVLDADDLYEPAFLTTMIRALQADPAAGAAYCGYRFVDQENRPLPGGESRLVPPEHLYQALAEGNFLVPEAMLVRRACYTAVGPFDETLRACEDMDMWMRIAQRYKVIGVADELTRHRVLAGSMSSNPTRMTDNRLAVLRRHFGQEPADPTRGSPQLRRVFGRAYLASVIEYLQVQDQPRAQEWFWRLACVAPELLCEVETFYEIGCGDQAKGFRGHLATVDLAQSASRTEAMLRALFEQPAPPLALQPQRNAIYASAYVALGMLGYNAGQYGLARSYFCKALRWQPRVLFAHHADRLFVRSLVPRVLLRGVKELKANRNIRIAQL